jgi:hypothetical protein
MFKTLKSAITGLQLTLEISVKSLDTKQQNSPSKARKPKRCAYQIAERKKWSENEYYTLLQHSFLGKSRQQLHELLGREPGKIFSKLQKHMKTVDMVKDILEKALRRLAHNERLITLS